MQLCPKIKDIGAKMPCMCFCLISYDKRYCSYHTSRESRITSADFVSNIKSLNVILYNSSVNKKLVLCYILNTILCFCSILEHVTLKAITELLSVSEQHSGV